MKIYYDDEKDLLYLRFEEKKQETENKRVSEDVVLDLGKGGKIVGIEILDASNHVDLRSVLPTTYEIRKAG